LRVVKGTAVYTGAFNPPSAPLTAITNTKFLINPSASKIFDVSKNHRVRLASTTSSTTRTKHASASIRPNASASGHGVYFDDKGDDAERLYFGRKNFTIEFWYWLDSTINSSEKTLFEVSPGGFNNNITCQLRSGFGLFVYITGGNINSSISGFDSSTMGSANNNMLSTAWTHVALTRVYDKIYLYLNGTLVATKSTSGTQDINTTGTFVIAGGYSNGADVYIEDFRVSLDHVRLPLDTVAKTLTADSNTFLLACHAASSTTVSGSWSVATNGTAPTVYDFGPADGMKSVYFPQNSDQVLKLTHTGASSVYTMGSTTGGAADNMSIEFWFWLDEDDFSANTHIMSTYNASSSAANFQIGFQSNNLRIRGHSTSGSTYDIAISNHVHPRTWHHLYYSEEYQGGNTFNYSSYIDGKIMGNGTLSSSTGYDLQEFGLGGRWDNSYPFSGYISNFRIQRGTVAHAIAGNKFTPPTSELLG